MGRLWDAAKDRFKNVKDRSPGGKAFLVLHETAALRNALAEARLMTPDDFVVTLVHHMGKHAVFAAAAEDETLPHTIRALLNAAENHRSSLATRRQLAQLPWGEQIAANTDVLSRALMETHASARDNIEFAFRKQADALSRKIRGWGLDIAPVAGKNPSPVPAFDE